MKEDKVKKVFLEDLPRYTKGRYKGKINWEKCKNHKVKFIYDDIEGYIEIIDFIKSKHSRLLIRFDDKDVEMNVNHFQNCSLGTLINKKTIDFKIQICTRFQDVNRDITITDKKYIKDKKGRKWKYYKYKCYKCGFEGGKHWSIKDKEYKNELWIREDALLNQRQGCACCCSSPQIVVEHINSIVATNPWIINYLKFKDDAKKYTKCSNDKVFVLCLDCKYEKDKPVAVSSIYKNHSILCDICGDGKSYPEKLIFNVLTQLGVNFKTEKVFDWCKFIFKGKIYTARYDFYLPDINKIIETDGRFHTSNNTMNKQTAEESKYIDDEKDRLANEQGIDVIRIDCEISDLEYIKENILSGGLKENFDLSKIDWLKAEKFALSNRVKEACSYKNNNSNMTSGDISKIMKLSKATITSYLKIGNRLGWCHYDAKEEMRKSGILSCLKKWNKI